MEIGNKIKNLRTRRGVTQEELASKLGITAQAVSKWENGAASPDIALLPALSAYFGVTIDELFALSDDTRMERIQNMLWDVRFLQEADVSAARDFLLEKAKREPGNGRALELLADLENHLAKAHHDKAADYAKEALRRDPNLMNAAGELATAMGGKCWDWGYTNHRELIDWLYAHLKERPEDWHTYQILIDQLLDDYRFAEAWEVHAHLMAIHDSYRCERYRGIILWHEGKHDEAFAVWEALMAANPTVWVIPDTIADHLVRMQRYEEAIRYYRRAFEVAKAPRYVDPIVAIAQVYEVMGNREAAIAAYQEELAVLRDEWHCNPGEETWDEVARAIERLKR